MSPRSVRSLPAPAPFTTVRASPDAPILSQSRLAIQHDLLVCKPRPAAWHGNPTHPSERTALGWGRCVFPGAGSGARAPNQAKPCVQSVGHDAPVPPQAGASVTSAIFSSARKSERNQLPVIRGGRNIVLARAEMERGLDAIQEPNRMGNGCQVRNAGAGSRRPARARTLYTPAGCVDHVKADTDGRFYEYTP